VAWGYSDCNTVPTKDTIVTVTGEGSASFSYYPATFWVPEVCTAPADDPACATAYDSRTLKRYEIKPGKTFPSGRSYADELQNFANWFQYYRKRKLTLAASMGKILQRIDGINLGTVSFSNQVSGQGLVAPTMYDMDSTTPSTGYQVALAPFYRSNANSSTPTRKTMRYIGQQFSGSTIVRYACQRNAALIATDGYADDAAAAVPSYDASLYGNNRPPFATTYAGTLADLALAYYTNNLRPAMSTGKVPTSDNDANPNLHMTTYAVSIGSKGNLWPAAAAPTTDSPTSYWSATTFGTAGANASAIDELWHATINGRGEMFLATTPDATADAMQSAFDAIRAQRAGQASASVGSANLTRSNGKAYVTSYNVSGWTGDLSANAMDSTTGIVSATLNWSASSRLSSRNWTDRSIATYDGSAGQPFTATAVGTKLNPGNTYGSTSDLVDYLRGNRSGEGSTWRKRSALLGAIINASPIVSRDGSTVFQASNEGMLHAFNATSGQELWSYIPGSALTGIGATSQKSYRFSTQLDATPTLVTVSGQEILLGGRGSAGTGWYALDVTNASAITSDAALAGRVKWEFPNDNTSATVRNRAGLSVGAPRIVRIKGASSSVALLSSGYNNAAQDGIGRLFVLDALTGALQTTLTTPAGASGDPGFAQFSPYFEDDGSVQYVYGGDERGNLWRFDLVNSQVNRVATLRDAYGTAQPITTAPALVYQNGKRTLFVATGRMLGFTDLSSTPGTQTVYAISDGDELTNPRGSLTQQVYDTATDTLTSNSVNWTTSRGWYIDLPAGEVVNAAPSIAYTAVVMVTNKSTISDCSASSRYYVVNMASGTAIAGVGYVSATISSTDMSSKMTLLRTASSSTSSGSSGSSSSCRSGGIAGMTTVASGRITTTALNLCQAIPSRKNAWTEIRR
jgi:type IV pilus assembly protein PilY1